MKKDLLRRKDPMIAMKEFRTLTQKSQYARLKADFPEAAKGRSRARKDELEAAYLVALSRIIPAGLGIPSTPDDIGMPVVNKEENTPKPDLPIPAGLEEMPKAEAKVSLPVRTYRNLPYVITGEDPTRELTTREMDCLDDVAKYLPSLGPKFQTAPKGSPGRRIFDPHKKERSIVQSAIKRLGWSKILVLKKEEPVLPAPVLLSGNV